MTAVVELANTSMQPATRPGRLSGSVIRKSVRHDGEAAELDRVEDDLPGERIGEELPPLREARGGQRLVVEGAHRDQEQERNEKERRVRQREWQRELPLGRPQPSHLATSLLKRSIQAARSGLIFDQSCRMNFPISSSDAIGRSGASVTCG